MPSAWKTSRDRSAKADRERERRRATLMERLAVLESVAYTGALDSGAVQVELQDQLTHWRALLCRQVAQAQQILRKLLVGRVTFTPATDEQGRLFTFQGQGAWAECSKEWLPSLSTLRLSVQGVGSPSGFEAAVSLKSLLEFLSRGSVINDRCRLNDRAVDYDSALFSWVRLVSSLQ